MINSGRRAPRAAVGGLDVTVAGRRAPPPLVPGGVHGLGCPHPPRRTVGSPLAVPVIFCTTAPPQLL